MERRSAWIVPVLLLPGAGFLAVFFLWPLLSTLLLSITDEPNGGFTGLFYERIMTRATYWRGLKTSLYYGLVPVLPTMVLSVIFALLLRRHFVGRALFNGLYKIPMAVPGIVVALVMIVMVERGGFVDRLLYPLGLSLPKLVRDEWGIGVILATTWKQVPFMTIIVTGAFASIPVDLVAAARTLGASRLRAFFHVELPLALPGISAAILLTFITSMGSYAIPDLVGPPNPRPLSVIMVALYNEGEFAQVYAMGIVLSAISVVVLLAYYALTSTISTRRSDRDI